MDIEKLTKQVALDSRFIPVTLTIKDAFVILSGLEVAAAPPNLGHALTDSIYRIVRKIRRCITDKHPDAQPGAKQAVIEKAMADERPIKVFISMGQAWIIVTSMQTAIRFEHVQKNAFLVKNLEAYGRLFQGSVVEMYPEAADVLEQGWSESDVER